MGAEILQGVGSAAAGLELTGLKIRVNSPCPPGAGALGVGAAGDGVGAGFRVWNICVKLPGWPVPDAGGAGAGTAFHSLGVSAGAAGAAEGILSIEIGLKTFASSSDGLDAGGALAASGVRSACSMRVKSPCADAVGGGAGGGAGVGGEAITSAAGVENIGEAGAKAGGAAGAGVKAGGAGVKAGGAGGVSSGFLVRAASRSSSSRGGGAETVPKSPVALEEAAPADSFEEGGWGLSERSLNASIWVHHLLDKIALFRNPRLHRLGLTVKSRQPTMQAHSTAARSGQVIAAWMIPFACAPGCEPPNSYDCQTVWLLRN